MFWGVNQFTRKWCELDTYGGKLVENATQAVARDLLADAIVRLDTTLKIELLTTVHDEIVAMAAGRARRKCFPRHEIRDDPPPDVGQGAPALVFRRGRPTLRQIVMRSVALLLSFTLAYPTDAHCYRTWRYPWPQRGCSTHALHVRVVRAQAHVIEAPKVWSVEITRLPPLTDDELHALAVEKLKEQTR